MKLIQSEEQKEKKRVKRKDSLRDLWGNTKWTNVHMIGVQEEKREKLAESLLERAMAESFPNVGMEINIHIKKSLNHFDRYRKRT